MITLADFKGKTFDRPDTGERFTIVDETEREFILTERETVRFVPKSHLIELFREGTIFPLDN